MELAKKAIFLLTIVALAGCNEELRTKRSPAQNLGRFLGSAANLSSNQQTIAYDVCLALRSKNTVFRAELGGHKFVYDLEHVNCSGERFSSSVEAILKVPSETNIAMEWVADSTKFFRYEETHEHGVLSSICTEVLKGQAPPNTFDASDGSRVQVRFASGSAGQQLVSAAHAKADSAGQYVVFKQDDFSVVTGKVNGNVYPGVLINRVQTVPCANGKSETLTQKYRHD